MASTPIVVTVNVTVVDSLSAGPFCENAIVSGRTDVAPPRAGPSGEESADCGYAACGE